jgi:hypothetical protein
MGTQNNKPMKTTGIILAVLGATLFLAGCRKGTSWSLDQSGAASKLKPFLAAQEAQARALAKQDGISLPADFYAFYRTAESGDWQMATNHFGRMRQRFDADRSLLGSWWSATLDAEGVLVAFPPGDKYAIAFGHDIIQSIPPGSIYFGGTDPGRFVVTALMESHADGKPFFMLSQNPLPDVTYLRYLRAMYGGKIHTPTDEDSQKCIEECMAETQRLFTRDRGSQDSSRRDQMSWQMSGIVGTRGLLTKIIFDKNPDREFYLEESFPLDWMRPYLEPHGLILKINRQPLPELSAEIVQRDSDYWTKYMTPMIGDWLKPDTTIEEIAAFEGKIQVKKDGSGFTGDPQLVQNEYWSKSFSKLRTSIGGLYAWRAQHTTGAGEKKRMNEAADFAFRQAWALCPYSSETVFRYVAFLMSEGRTADALLITETAAQMPPMQGSNGEQLRFFINELERYQKGDPNIHFMTSEPD